MVRPLQQLRTSSANLHICYRRMFAPDYGSSNNNLRSISTSIISNTTTTTSKSSDSRSTGTTTTTMRMGLSSSSAGHDNSIQQQRRRRRRNQHNNTKQQNQQQQQRSQIKTPKKTNNIFATINEAQDSMQELLDRIEITNINSNHPITVETLSKLNLFNLHNNNNNNNNDHDNNDIINGGKIASGIYIETMEYFDTLIRSVNDGRLTPSRKHGQELSQLIECVLYVFGQTQKQSYWYNDIDYFNNNDNNNNNNIIQNVLKVLEIDWNLDINNQHYEHSISAACNVQDYDYASYLFEKQINPNGAGTPVSTLSIINNPLGLYALTQRYNTNNTNNNTNNNNINNKDSTSSSSSMIVEHVMDAVQRLVMVSPQDKTSYVLAAGNALGYAGYWKDFDEYRRSSFLSEQYGTSLVSAVIQAYCLCGRYDEALQILQEENIITTNLVPSSSSSSLSSSKRNLEEEWQWGGERDRIDPLCRDLAMQVIGGASATIEGGGGGNVDHHDNNNDNDDSDSSSYSKLALMLFHQSREENVTISREALLGVVEACERDKDWKSALSVLRTVIEEDEIEHEKNNSNNNNNNIASWIVPGSHLTIIERDQRANDGNFNSPLSEMGPFLASIMRNCNSSSNFGMSLFSLRLFQMQLLFTSGPGHHSKKMNKNDDASTRTEDSIGQIIFEVNNSQEILSASMVALCGLRCHENAMRLYEMQKINDNASAALIYRYASSNQKRSGTIALGNPWISAHRHIDQLTEASKLIRKILRQNKKNESNYLTENQREMIEEVLARAMNSCTNAHQPELSLYLLDWMDEFTFSHHQQQAIPEENIEDINKDGLYKDSVTAETILALRWTRDLTGAIEILESILEKHAEDDLDQWRKTIAAGLTVMVAKGRGGDAVQVFDVLDKDVRSTDCYSTIGRHLSKVKDWKELIDLYRNATTEGYSSEELSLLAMTAVISTKVDNRLRILRAIVDECASNVGLDPKRWTMNKYWQIKRTLGFHHARLLMWWNDEQRAPLDEMNLAIKEFYNDQANGMRPKNDVARAIVSGASRYDSFGLEYTGGYEKVPRSVENWTVLLEEVLHAMKGSAIRYDPNWVNSVVLAYKSLGRSRECVEYISNVMDVDGTRIRKSTLVEVLEAARVEHDEELYNNIQMMLSRGNNTNDTSPQSLER
jgi:hypothetical protein